MSTGLPDSDVEAIAAVRDSFVTALAEDDVESLLAFLTADGSAFPPHEPAVVGHEANRAWHEARISDFESVMALTTDELVGEGSMAFERFSYTLTLTPRAGGDPIVDSGRCFWIWRKSEGSWKVARAMWNGPDPLPEG